LKDTKHATLSYSAFTCSAHTFPFLFQFEAMKGGKLVTNFALQTYYGDKSLFTKQQSKFSVKSDGYGEALQISKRDFFEYLVPLVRRGTFEGLPLLPLPSPPCFSSYLISSNIRSRYNIAHLVSLLSHSFEIQIPCEFYPSRTLPLPCPSTLA
jgi:hypothetical protein